MWRKNFFKKIFSILTKIVICISLFSCGRNEEVYLYDKSGFVPVGNAGGSQYINQRNQQNIYQRPQQYNPYGYQPNSRAYSNPYDFQQPTGGYSPYYDTERYYVPPSYYRNVEPVNNNYIDNMKY